MVKIDLQPFGPVLELNLFKRLQVNFRQYWDLSGFKAWVISIKARQDQKSLFQKNPSNKCGGWAADDTLDVIYQFNMQLRKIPKDAFIQKLFSEYLAISTSILILNTFISKRFSLALYSIQILFLIPEIIQAWYQQQFWEKLLRFYEPEIATSYQKSF